jgi:hypothetical protein
VAKKKAESAGDRLKASILELYVLSPAELLLLDKSAKLADALARIDAATGAVRWRTDFDDVPRSVAAAGELVYVTLPLVALCAVRPPDGRIDWCTTELRVPAVGPPVLHGGRLYLALLDTTLRTFNPSTGTMLRRDSLKGRPATPPMPLGPTLVTPLSQNAFAIVTPSGTITVVPAPETGSRLSIRRAAISQGAATIVTLTIEVAASLYLSAYKPTPPAPVVGPTTPLPVPPNTSGTAFDTPPEPRGPGIRTARRE